jgi:hypothetical protein
MIHLYNGVSLETQTLNKGITTHEHETIYGYKRKHRLGRVCQRP